MVKRIVNKDMELQDLKVGMSARVFTVTHNSYYRELIGNFFTEGLDEYYGNEFGVSYPSKEFEHLGIDKERNHARLVGKLTITKLK